MLEIGIDEFTIVLQLSPEFKDLLEVRDWMPVAKNIIDIFCEKADFYNVFGEELIITKGLPEGYTHGYTYGEHAFSLAIGMHEYRIDMGVVVHFSAQALDYYCEVSGLKPYELMQMVQDEFYSIRLSRVDLTLDYIDENLDVTEIYKNYLDRKIGIFKEVKSKKNDEVLYRRIPLKIEGYIKEDAIPTIYLGSKKSNTFLRIYDKKREQIERKGNKYEKAISTENWVRFEGVFRNEYAHQISNALMNVNNDEEYLNLIACTMIQKYKFMYIENGVVDCETEFSQQLMDCIEKGCFVLKATSSRNYELLKSINYIFNGSGVFATLYKIRSIWGENALIEMSSIMYKYLNEYIPNDDCNYWLNKNCEDYRKNYPDYKKFYMDNVYPIFLVGEVLGYEK